ncbi:MAG: class I SAM-dependent methyltransferase [Lachnospiraceae bacterium]|jgi:hypothetical protein|nr:class I SAM-dependent methyltransferase [Lachnospiraceae bacterium]
MNNMDNLRSYDNVEYLQVHELSDKELFEYYNLKMNTAQSNAEFIEKEVITGGGYQRANICEIGGGNGKLLYCLEEKGLLRKGINYEVSKSRCELAVKFAEISSSQNVEIRNCNFLEDIIEQNEYDCIVMVDIVLQIISPLYDAAESDTINWIKTALKKGGYLFIEIVDYSDMIKYIKNKGSMYTWKEFSKGDPFQYSLDKFSIDKDNNLICEKKFIGRDNDKRDYFKNVIHSYTLEEITRILEMNGFSTKFYLCNDSSLPESERNNTYRILAKKV